MASNCLQCFIDSETSSMNSSRRSMTSFISASGLAQSGSISWAVWLRPWSAFHGLPDRFIPDITPAQRWGCSSGYRSQRAGHLFARS